jgi:hypothetical protein
MRYPLEPAGKAPSWRRGCTAACAQCAHAHDSSAPMSVHARCAILSVLPLALSCPPHAGAVPRPLPPPHALFILSADERTSSSQSPTLLTQSTCRQHNQQRGERRGQQGPPSSAPRHAAGQPPAAPLPPATSPPLWAGRGPGAVASRKAAATAGGSHASPPPPPPHAPWPATHLSMKRMNLSHSNALRMLNRASMAKGLPFRNFALTSVVVSVPSSSTMNRPARPRQAGGGVSTGGRAPRVLQRRRRGGGGRLAPAPARLPRPRHPLVHGQSARQRLRRRLVASGGWAVPAGAAKSLPANRARGALPGRRLAPSAPPPPLQKTPAPVPHL